MRVQATTVIVKTQSPSNPRGTEHSEMFSSPLLIGRSEREREFRTGSKRVPGDVLP